MVTFTQPCEHMYLKMVQVVNCMLCVLYHNFNKKDLTGIVGKRIPSVTAGNTET